MIHIGENYRIDKDKLNWILQEKRVTDPNHHKTKSDIPEERWIDIGYFGRIEQLLNHLLNSHLLQSNVNTLEDIKTLLKQTENILKIRVEQVTSYPIN
ncbi:hypothetical protein P9E34_04085 [Schinkia azotoformans]|uniref:hypothetical protein n=1 Tax=Schinkia azotoformans TaxID=1454 RepID=UPI002DB7CFFA|nr:hypothetical protein [Schinkia azotoformans]MEC1723925.1 hypothetical protein [Schinkia azotoformans]